MSAPIGQRFSLVYLDRGIPANDSQRFRQRLAGQFFTSCPGRREQHEFGVRVIAEAGASVPSSAGYYKPGALFTDGALRDVLDAITLFYEFLVANVARELRTKGLVPVAQLQSPLPVVWREFVARAMQEEAVGYRVDEKCGVHYFVDEEFETNRAATVAALAHPLLANARSAHEDAFRHLDSQPRDTKAAVRSMFEAVEIIARQICPEARNLYRGLVEKALKEKCLAVAGGDEIERTVLAGLFDALGRWVDAVHFYRHGQDAPEPVAPSDELAIYVLSTGSAHARQLAMYFIRIGDTPQVPATGHANHPQAT